MNEFINNNFNSISIILTTISIIIPTASVIISAYLNYGRTRPPNIIAYFRDPYKPKSVDTDKIKLEPNTDGQPIEVYFKNIGKYPISGGDFCIYVPNPFEIRKLEYLGETKQGKQILRTRPEHPHSNTNYVFTGKVFDLSPQEPGEVTLTVKTPNKLDDYPLFIHFTTIFGEVYRELTCSICHVN